MRIPFDKPSLTGNELEYARRVIESAELAADGVFTQRCARLLEERLRVTRVLMTPSCTSALEMAVMLCKLEPGDEVMMPSFTFVSTANAVVRARAHPVFVDIRPDTLNIDETLIERAITSRTKAVFAVHYAGVACEMDAISEIAAKHKLIVLEDAAQGVNAFYRGRALGTIGLLGAYSFHHTKNYVCGEGGAICINTPELTARAEIIREKGTNRGQFSRGEVDKYSWVDVGSSYLPAEISCAFLCAQLEAMDRITEQRRRIYNFYYNALERPEKKGLLTRPIIPEGCLSNYHSFHTLLPSAERRDAAMRELAAHGIQTAFHYVPLHVSPMGMQLGRAAGPLGVTECVSARLLRLPFYNEITESDQMEVVERLTTHLES